MSKLQTIQVLRMILINLIRDN